MRGTMRMTGDIAEGRPEQLQVDVAPARIRTFTVRVAAARSVRASERSDPAASVPSEKHTRRPARCAPVARATLSWGGGRRHVLTPVAGSVPVLRTTSVARRLPPLVTMVRSGNTVSARLPRGLVCWVPAAPSAAAGSARASSTKAIGGLTRSTR